MRKTLLKSITAVLLAALCGPCRLETRRTPTGHAQRQSRPRSILAHLKTIAWARPEATTYSGLYVNKDYAYSVQVPAGMVAEGAAVGAPNHGFVIRFSKGEDDYLGVDASFAAVQEPDQGVQSNDAAGTRNAAIRRQAVRLAGLRGERTIVRRTVGSQLIVLDISSAKREESDPPIVYTISLKTAGSTYERRLRVLRRVVSSFKLLPLQ